MQENQGQDDSFISLGDIIDLLMQYKKLLVSFFLFIFGVSVVYVLLQKPTYVFRQQLTLTNYYATGGFVPVAPRAELLAQINNYYLPLFVNEYNSKRSKNKINLLALNFSIAAFKQTSSDIVIEMRAAKNKLNTDFYNKASKYTSNILKQQEKPYINALTASLNVSIATIKKQLPAFEQLHSLEMKIDTIVPNALSTAAGLQEIRDMYITSLGATNSYSQLYGLIVQLNQDEQTLKTMMAIKTNDTLYVKSIEMSKLAQLVVSFFLALMLSVFIICIYGFILKKR